jgi:hypothetical protein
MAYYRPNPAQRRKARDIAEKREAAGLGPLRMKQVSPEGEEETEISKPAYGPMRRKTKVTKKKG